MDEKEKKPFEGMTLEEIAMSCAHFDRDAITSSEYEKAGLGTEEGRSSKAQGFMKKFRDLFNGR